MLNTIRPWQNCYHFFGWLKTRKFFPLDTIFYNVVMKCLRQGRQFEMVERLAYEMVDEKVELDNVMYSTVITCLKKCRRFASAIGWFERMYKTGVVPDEVTYSAVLEVYAKLGKREEVVGLYERARGSGWKPDAVAFSVLARMFGEAGDYDGIQYVLKEMSMCADFILYNTLLSMCADLGLEEEAEELFEDMKRRKGRVRPDNWSYTAMINIYGSGGKEEKALVMFEEMLGSGIEPNVMSCTCLIQCLAKARRVKDAVRVFGTSLAKGVKPDDRLCGCLLSVIAMSEGEGEMDMLLSCLEKANARLVEIIKVLGKEETSFNQVKDELRGILNEASVEVRRPFCNCLIDICRNQGFPSRRAHEILYLGNLYGLYPGLHAKSADEWSLNLTSLSVGAANTAFEDWMKSLSTSIENEEVLPQNFWVHAGARTHRFWQGLPVAFASHLKKLTAPFRRDELRSGSFVAVKEDLISWVQSRSGAAAFALL